MHSANPNPTRYRSYFFTGFESAGLGREGGRYVVGMSWRPVSWQPVVGSPRHVKRTTARSDGGSGGSGVEWSAGGAAPPSHPARPSQRSVCPSFRWLA